MGTFLQSIKRLSRKRTFRIALFALLGSSAAVWAVYAWRFQSLPQAAIYFLDDVPEPRSGQTILVFAPHPDDETIATGGFIALERKRGAAVWVVLVTNGNKHGIGARRDHEFHDALDILGQRRENRLFLNYPDAQLARQNKQALRREFEAIITQTKPHIILAPHPDDKHPDHAVTGALVESVCRERGILLYQYLVHYPRFPLPKKFAPALCLLPPVRLVSFDKEWRRVMLPADIEALKRQAVRRYRSQLRVPVLRSLLLGMVRRNELLAVPEEFAGQVQAGLR
jgi:LmbE family N-acetylglucosaminyl deacetylase